MTAAAEGEDADLVVLNTCHIREKAAEKAYSDVGRLQARGRLEAADRARRLRRPGRRRGGQAPLADDRHRRRPAGLSPPARDGRRGRARRTPGRHRHAGDQPSSTRFRARRRASPSAFLTVQEGCDKFCTYCVVPYTRGAEISRPWSDIVAEARPLVDAGAREIILLGQNVNAWTRRRARGLAELIRALARIDGLARIRYTTSHPADMNDALIAAHGEVDKLMPYLHLPVQSGSEPHPQGDEPQPHASRPISRMLDKMRAARPDIALSGDFIVGFPGETEADFEATLSIVDAVGYASAYSFKYSAAARHARGDHGGPDPARSHGRAAAAAAGRGSTRTSSRSTRLEGRAPTRRS